MFDLYLAIVPVVAGLALLNLLVLKLAIKDNTTISKLRQNPQLLEQLNGKNEDESPTKITLKYLLLHFTPLEIFAVRRAKYKLPLLLSISVIALGTYLVPSPYYFVAIGTITYFLYFFIAKTITQSKQQTTLSPNSNNYREKYLQVIIGTVTLGINAALVGLFYKNYHNTVLSTFLANLGLNIVFDNFVVRPTFALIIGIPMSFNNNVFQFVQNCQKEVALLERYESVGEKEHLMMPLKITIPKPISNSIAIDFDIQPKIISQEQLKKQEETHERAIELLRKIKKQKILPPINNIRRTEELEGSLNSLFNSSKKEQDSQIDEPIEEHHIEDKQTEEEPELKVKKKFCSENLILINPSQQEPVENEEDIDTENIENKKITEHEDDDDFQFPKKRGATCIVSENCGDPLRISIHDSDNPTSRQQPLRICMNDDLNLGFRSDKSDEEDVDNYRKRRQLMTIDDAINKTQNFGLLEIKDKNPFGQGDQIEEIDLNSPQRRRRQGLHVEYEVESRMEGVKKKKKKLSHDNHRVIRFSTGEPYLQYLPNMLSKDKNKKSQAINRKEAVMDSRVVNSVKRPAKKKVLGQHNQNIVPEFKIEEL